MGDVAGIGPEIIAGAWPTLHELCQPIVVGDAGWMRRGLEFMRSNAKIQHLTNTADATPGPRVIPVLPGSSVPLDSVEVGKVTWPTRNETLISTIMVLAFCALASVFFLLADQIIAWAVTTVLAL